MRCETQGVLIVPSCGEALVYLRRSDETRGIRGNRLVNVKDGRNLPGRRLSGWKQYPSYEAALARTGVQANTRDPRSWMNDLIIVSIFAFREERERDSLSPSIEVTLLGIGREAIETAVIRYKTNQTLSAQD